MTVVEDNSAATGESAFDAQNSAAFPSANSDHAEPAPPPKTPMAVTKRKFKSLIDGTDNASDDDDEARDFHSPGKPLPIVPLRPGDVTEHTSPVFVAGSQHALRRACVTNTDPNQNFPIYLSNRELVPCDTYVRRIGELVEDKLHSFPGCFREITKHTMTENALPGDTGAASVMKCQGNQLREAAEEIIQGAFQVLNSSPVDALSLLPHAKKV